MIPFHVKDTRKTSTAVRFGVDVLTGLMQASASPAVKGTFPVRMLRWVAVSPDGKRVVYQALGYLYVRDLPSGAPKRLTTQTDHFEFYPSWSRDGKSIVYTTWNDDTLGSIRVAAVAGRRGPRRHGEARPLRRARLLARRHEDRLPQADGRIPPVAAWSADPGIYVVPAAGGSPRSSSRTASPRSFGGPPTASTSSDRGRRRPGAPEKRVLASIKLDGSDDHEYYLSELAQEFAVSPDGKWVAFRERFNAYVDALRRRPASRVDIGPKSKARAPHEGLEGRRRESALVRRLVAGSTGRSGRSSSSARSRTPSRSSPARRRSCPSRRSPASTSPSTPRSTHRAERSPSSAAASSP